jgi:hypothetical protein
MSNETDLEVVAAYINILSRYCTEIAEGTHVTWPIFELRWMLSYPVGVLFSGVMRPER